MNVCASPSHADAWDVQLQLQKELDAVSISSHISSSSSAGDEQFVTEKDDEGPLTAHSCGRKLNLLLEGWRAKEKKLQEYEQSLRRMRLWQGGPIGDPEMSTSDAEDDPHSSLKHSGQCEPARPPEDTIEGDAHNSKDPVVPIGEQGGSMRRMASVDVDREVRSGHTHIRNPDEQAPFPVDFEFKIQSSGLSDYGGTLGLVARSVFVHENAWSCMGDDRGDIGSGNEGTHLTGHLNSVPQDSASFMKIDYRHSQSAGRACDTSQLCSELPKNEIKADGLEKRSHGKEEADRSCSFEDSEDGNDVAVSSLQTARTRLLEEFRAAETLRAIEHNRRRRSECEDSQTRMLLATERCMELEEDLLKEKTNKLAKLESEQKWKLQLFEELQRTEERKLESQKQEMEESYKTLMELANTYKLMEEKQVKSAWSRNDIEIMYMGRYEL